MLQHGKSGLAFLRRVQERAYWHPTGTTKGSEMSASEDGIQTEAEAPPRKEWAKPKLEKLSMRSAETANTAFRFNDGATNYS